MERVGHALLPPGRLRLVRLDGSVTDAQSGPQKASFPNVVGFGAGGDDTTIPFSKSYSYTGSPAEPGSQTVTGYNNANASSTDSVTITADSSAPSGHLRLGHRRLLHGALDRRHTRQRLRHRLRDRRCERHRRARRGAARQRRRLLRRLPGLVVDGHARGRQRHHRHQRQLLPLPLPALRPRRQPGHLGRQRNRQGRHERPGRAEPQLRLALERGGHRRHRLLPPLGRQRPVPGHGRCERRAVRHREPQLPGRGLGLERLRLGQRAHLQPHRLAHRSGRAERRRRSQTAPA